jgi:hypothetical protein
LRVGAPDGGIFVRRLGQLTLLISAVLVALAVMVPVSAGGRPLSATLSGAEEVPPADPDGSGAARLTVNPGQGEVCFHVTSTGITLPVVAAHIHPGVAGVVGPPLVFLLPPGMTDADGSFSGCSEVDRATAKDILKNPSAYYVNLHTSDFPAGAIRGQLG